MNKYKWLVVLLGFSTQLFAHPFDAGRWVNGDYNVTTSVHQPIPFDGKTSTHRMSYTLPSGVRSSTDMCYVSSDTTLTCWVTGEQLVVDAATFSATLTSSNKPVFKYYEPYHEPESSRLSGHWRRYAVDLTHCANKNLHELRIPNQPVDAKTFKRVTYIGYDGVTYDGGNLNLVRYTPTGQLVLGDSTTDSDYFINRYALYDAYHDPIMNPADVNRVIFLNDTSPEYRYDSNCDIARAN